MAPDSSQAYVGYSSNTKRQCISPSGRQLCPAQQQTLSVPAREGSTDLLHWTGGHSSLPAAVCCGFHSQPCPRSPGRTPVLTPAPEREHFTFQPGQGQGPWDKTKRAGVGGRCRTSAGCQNGAAGGSGGRRGTSRAQSMGTGSSIPRGAEAPAALPLVDSGIRTWPRAERDAPV